MSVNEFKAFATGENANVISQTEYDDLTARESGFETGIARSEQLNKVWRQASTIAAVVAQFMADKSGDDVADDGDIEKLRDTLTKALMNNSIGQLDGRYLKSASNLSDVANSATARVNLGLKGAAVQDVGTTAGTVAAGNDSRIVNAAQRGNNLSDLTDKAVARNNLGLKGAALIDVGTTAGTVAAGNDSRIINALQRGNNLSDLANKTTARVNLGLKSAAIADVGTAAGTVAAGNDSRIVNAVQRGNNLSDLTDKGVARNNLGLKGAALTDVGTSAGTVAAGNDSRIINALQRGNNLADLANKEVTRNNLGLGTAALANVQVSKDDATAGRAVLTGNAIAVRTNRYNNNLAETDFNLAPQNAVSFVYGGASNGPGVTGSVLDFSGLHGGYNVQLCGSYHDGGKYLKFRTRNGDNKVWGGWNSIYHTANKPTASDVGALSQAGGTLSGGITLNVDGEGLRLKTVKSGVASYIISRDADNSSMWYVGKGSSNNYDATFNNYKGGNNRIDLRGDGQIDLITTSAKPVTTNSELIVRSANALRVVSGNYGSFWRQDNANLYLMLTNVNDPYGTWNNLRPFQINLANGSVNIGAGLTVTGAVTPTNYSNFDSRYYSKAQSDARYIQGIRVSASAVRKFTPGGGWSPYDSAFVTAISMVGGMSNTGELLVRYIQRNINGTWVNVVA